MAKLRLLVAVGLAVVLAACGRSEDSKPDLLLVSARDSDYAIYVLNEDGSAQKRLTANDAVQSANGAFFQVEADWAPDGRRIAFASRRRGSFDIYVMNADGTDTRRLTATGDDDDNPTWSPDGRRLAFNRAGDIYAMNADGTNVRRVTADLDPQTDPAWSPDGEWIAYVRGSQGTVGVDLRELWLVQPDGGRNQALTTMGVSSYSPAWSPDSARIAFATNVASTRFDIYTIGLDGEDEQRVTDTAEDTFEPAWSPDGKTIAYSEDGAIYVIDVAGAAATRITDKANNDSSPAWSPLSTG